MNPVGLTAAIRDGMPLRVGLGAILLVVLGLGYWSVSVEISGAVIAHGRLQTVEDTHVLSHPIGGIVSDVLVREGDYVDAGDVIARMDSKELKIELLSIDEILAELLARRIRLIAERDGLDHLPKLGGLISEIGEINGLAERIASQEAVLQRHRDQLLRGRAFIDNRIDQVQAQIDAVDVQISAQRDELAVIEQELSDESSLFAAGWARQSGVSALQRQRINRAGEIGRLSAVQRELLEKLNEHQLSESNALDTARNQAQIELDRIEPEILETIAKRSAVIYKQRLAVLRAPIAGTIHNLKVTGNGFVIRAAAPILDIIPQQETMQAIVQVESVDIDQVFQQQDARLQFRAYNARALPILSGRISHIAADVTLDPIRKKYVYEAFVEISHRENAALMHQKLVSGMDVTAFISTQPEKPIAYLTRPIASYFQKAFRDR
ncbi:HlyD family type I secretion periplasmic adaptor subunit [Amylibacter marinus]|uniref:Membrane fusion protein (MFP) family protein n=1 Tax=Amylibacter marinus TaxID=1475483 RepID=A0ABQ5VY13_9RHOB|nr:HlyD family type I secretion periplasmic adaptor subunit [Amylibacter marinus]GLQ36160.1 HlyD family type I secretion periplasmic adaptor subunit [Amylibacter marinus]